MRKTMFGLLVFCVLLAGCEKAEKPNVPEIGEISQELISAFPGHNTRIVVTYRSDGDGKPEEADYEATAYKKGSRWDRLVTFDTTTAFELIAMIKKHQDTFPTFYFAGTAAPPDIILPDTTGPPIIIDGTGLEFTVVEAAAVDDTTPTITITIDKDPDELTKAESGVTSLPPDLEQTVKEYIVELALTLKEQGMYLVPDTDDPSIFMIVDKDGQIIAKE